MKESHKVLIGGEKMTAITLDTLAISNRLKESGCDPRVAEEQARIQVEMVHNLMETTLATKADINELALATKADINKLALATKAEYIKLDSRIDKLDARMDKLDSRIDNLESKVDKLKGSVIFQLGGMLVAATTILGFLIQLK